MDNKSSILPNNNLKEHDWPAVLGASTKGHMKGPWNHMYMPNSAPYTTADGSGYTNLSGFSWPPRMYVCGFCKREFRSAQALGGHMNVHRRDRARLRQSPPSSPPTISDSINLNLIPNPSPNLTQSSSTWMIQKPNNNTTATYITNPSIKPSLKPSCPFTVSSSSGSSASRMKVWSVARPNPSTNKTPNLLIDANNYTQRHNNFQMPWENGGLLRLGFGTSGLGKEDLDLELRLGYPS